MSKIFGFQRIHLGAYTLGVPVEVSAPAREVAQPAELFAVAEQLRGQRKTRVFAFPNTTEGLTQLAILAQGERILDVVLGHRVDLTVAKVVSLSGPSVRFDHSINLMTQDL
jgi:hypothetical protein